MKNNYLSLLLLTLVFASIKSYAFTCQALGKSINSSGTVSVFVDLEPSIQAGSNLVVDLGKSIQCKNDLPSVYKDPVRVASGSTFLNDLSTYKGSLTYFGSRYNFPMSSSTKLVNHTWDTYRPWETVLYLSPLSAAGGIFIQKGTLFAQLVLEKVDSLNNQVQVIVWNIYANNTVVVPTGGCDVSSRNVNVDLPDYDSGVSKAVPLTVHCPQQNHNLSFTLTGTTDVNSSTFQNIAPNGAKGIGIQLLRNNVPVAAGSSNRLGNVGATPVNLGLSAKYALTSGQVTAGLVKSVIDVTFTYE